MAIAPTSNRDGRLGAPVSAEVREALSAKRRRWQWARDPSVDAAEFLEYVLWQGLARIDDD